MRSLSGDAVKAILVIEMLTQGVYFDSRNVRSLPVQKDKVSRALKALVAAGVVAKSRARNKYLLTDEFLDAVGQEIRREMPRGTFVHHPDLSVFEICGIGSWSPEELNAYVKALTERWMLRKGAP